MALCQYDSSDVSCQSGEGVGGEAGSLHDRLVAYVHALAHGSRRGVWGEHSYARSRIGGAGAARAGRVRALLAPRASSPPPHDVDVVGLGELPPEPPGSAGDPLSHPAPSDDDDAGDDEWEARVAAAAPSAAHARLAAAAGDALRAFALERLAAGGAGGDERREQARAAARRLRRALALSAGAGRPPAAGWLHGALTAALPRVTRRLYEEAVGELRGSAPRLAERLTGAWAPAPTESGALPPAGAAVGPEAAPWLVWVASGRGSQDARWERRLAALLHTRVLRPAPAEPGAAPPAAWCAAAAARVRDQLTDALVDAGERSVILGGVGAGAALAAVLARGAACGAGGAGGVRGCALLAPPLLSAEAAAGEALAGVRLPLLVVAGGAAGAGAARALVAGGRGHGRRLLEVRGADGELRVPRATRRRLRLPRGALDAALVEEVARWALDAADRADRADDPPHDEYAHLPPASAPETAPPSRSIEVIEGRVVSRCAGGTPLTLAPPRREPAPLHAADIMQLPVVFADDTLSAAAGAGADSSSGGGGSGGSPVTVTSGGGAPGVKLTRVILASRGAGPAPAVGDGGARVLLRRPLRVLAPPPPPLHSSSSEH